MEQVKLRIAELINEKAQREGLDISPSHVAKAIGVSHNTILSYIRNEATQPDLRILYKLARYFGCKTGDLFQDELPEYGAALHLSRLAIQ